MRRTAYSTRDSTTPAMTWAVSGSLFSFCRRSVVAPTALPIAVLVTCSGRSGLFLRRVAAALTATAYLASRFFQSTPDVEWAHLREWVVCLFSHPASFRRSHAYSRGSLSRKSF